jgi:tRNA (guanine-N7-)-methyltransferase
MPKPLLIATGGSETEFRLDDLQAPVDRHELDRFLERAAGRRIGTLDGAGSPPPWEVEIGFGKGRYLLERAQAEPDCRFLGIEIATRYWRILTRRARRHGLPNLATVRGEALYALSGVLPQRFARAVHVYHPDPWPKAKHHKRRLFDPETVDLVVGLLQPGGTLSFGTDFIEYGELVAEILGGFPGLTVRRLDGGWPGGARTNYEAKYIEEGRPILRLVATLDGGDIRDLGDEHVLHPAGSLGLVDAWRPPPEDDEDNEGDEGDPGGEAGP